MLWWRKPESKMGGLLSSPNYPTLHPLRLTGLLSELNLTEMCSWSLFLTNYSTYHSFLINLPCSLRAHYVNLITSKSLLLPLQLLWLTLSQLSSKVQPSLNHSSHLKFHSELLSSPQFKTGPWLQVFLWERAFLLTFHFPSSSPPSFPASSWTEVRKEKLNEEGQKSFLLFL